MKGSGILFAPAVAAALTAFSLSGNRQVRVSTFSIEGSCSSSSVNDSALLGKGGMGGGGTSVEKFAPRFDGLRFIETLVTAHR